ncbi:hypothetical protein TWF730_008765 [Orbilia blumenaviensis]|uniref:Uncharacterized protein n=1 Tax=Orbilia blumenaviensis TaxID=1796055 RepID=A0AAV9V6H9_9PEZI
MANPEDKAPDQPYYLRSSRPVSRRNEMASHPRPLRELRPRPPGSTATGPQEQANPGHTMEPGFRDRAVYSQGETAASRRVTRSHHDPGVPSSHYSTPHRNRRSSTPYRNPRHLRSIRLPQPSHSLPHYDQSGIVQQGDNSSIDPPRRSRRPRLSALDCDPSLSHLSPTSSVLNHSSGVSNNNANGPYSGPDVFNPNASAPTHISDVPHHDHNVSNNGLGGFQHEFDGSTHSAGIPTHETSVLHHSTSPVAPNHYLDLSNNGYWAGISYNDPGLEGQPWEQRHDCSVPEVRQDADTNQYLALPEPKEETNKYSRDIYGANSQGATQLPEAFDDGSMFFDMLPVPDPIDASDLYPKPHSLMQSTDFCNFRAPTLEEALELPEFGTFHIPTLRPRPPSSESTAPPTRGQDVGPNSISEFFSFTPISSPSASVLLPRPISSSPRGDTQYFHLPDHSFPPQRPHSDGHTHVETPDATNPPPQELDFSDSALREFFGPDVCFLKAKDEVPEHPDNLEWLESTLFGTTATTSEAPVPSAPDDLSHKRIENYNWDENRTVNPADLQII